MNVETPLEAETQFARAGKRGMEVLDWLEMRSQLLPAIYSVVRNACRCSALLRVLTAAGEVMVFVRTQIARMFAAFFIQALHGGEASTVRSNDQGYRLKGCTPFVADLRLAAPPSIRRSWLDVQVVVTALFRRGSRARVRSVHAKYEIQVIRMIMKFRQTSLQHV
ncbi:hypothetical protein [Paraburkholderia acidipaludis]|uniref:hypothetical protein n=1 Tax=Paraburkholderia acidipaludis TaxID=660537 RepID=UPI000487FE40|nr:hypothetical protein [Paraburkholderia acidipaludis]